MAEQAIQCTADCTVTVQLAPAPPQTDNLADIGVVFGLLLGIVFAVFCMRQLLNLFIAPDDK
ncbi:hypothetical protein [Variovorax sp. Varisp36]|uniref:hypothetical protein n=1 Tax=Variovorax sp. Varisp36 TaxID=3243031 RepID=UPI0039A61B0C